MVETNDRLMISVAGVRGIVGRALTPEVAAGYAAAFGTFIGRGRIILGRDSRPSGQVMELAAEAGLRSVGCQVVKIGIVPTPTVQLMVKQMKAKGGLAITASHNPPQWNALKFIGAGGGFLSAEEGRQMLAVYDQQRFLRAAYTEIGGVEAFDQALDRHVESILRLPFVVADRIRRRRLRVVCDTCHGAGGPIFSRLLKKLGCQEISLHYEPSGDFSRPIEPRAGNLGELERAVRKHRADVGFATDADVDRLSLVDEAGQALGEEYTLPLAARYRLSQKRGVVVTNLSTSNMVEAVALARNSRVVRTPVGEANVVVAMKKHRAVLGGEGNGGVIIPELNYARDATAAMALILMLLAETGQPLSRLARSLPKYAMIKEEIETESPAALVKKTAIYFHNQPQDHSDGVKIFFADGWLHVRASGTEPVVRAIAESEKADGARFWIERVKELARERK